MSTTTRQARRQEALLHLGVRQASYARSTGTLVVVYDGAAQGLDVDGGRWSAVCDDHGYVIATETLTQARSAAREPQEWCGRCSGQDTEPAPEADLERPPVDALTFYAGEAQAAVEAVQDALPAALEDLAATLQDAQVVPFVAWCQDMRRLLLDLESTATEYAGKHLGGVGSTGTLADGRAYTVKRGRNRTAWDHDGWQHDARAAVLRSMNVPALVVDPIQGDVVNLLEVLTAVQQIHGSGAPRVTALRALGLAPDGYCESSPGRWSIDFVDPEPTPVRVNE